MKPIDFISNPIVEETIFISLDHTATLAAYQKGDYSKQTDAKWLAFCNSHNLSKRESTNPKWHELYLQLCAERML